MFLQAQLNDNELKSEEREQYKKIRLAKESSGAVLHGHIPFPPFFSYSFLPLSLIFHSEDIAAIIIRRR
jgi:hypothetical protein